MTGSLELRVAFSMLPGMDAPSARMLWDNGIDPDLFMTLPLKELQERVGASVRALTGQVRENAISKARKEIDFAVRHGIRISTLFDDDYPILLREIPDAPLALYVLGSCNLSAYHMLSVVGTRKCTQYGLSFCRDFLKNVSEYFNDCVIVSGLAYGIDATAHIGALENGLPTVAVVAHGLDMVYPAQHRELARDILRKGGAIVSEYPSATKPFRGNFLSRNRIVAGLTELTFVVESEIKGGAMSTANTAFSYDRTVYSLPGRVGDISSSGCNHLISTHKAHIFTTISEMFEDLKWPVEAKDKPVSAPVLFPELTGNMAVLNNMFSQSGGRPMAVDELHRECGLSMPELLSALNDLEFEGLIAKLPGARYVLS